MISVLVSGISTKCIALKDSKLCSVYKDYSVNIPSNSTEKMHFTNIAGFDAFVSRRQVFNMESACPTWPSIGNDPIPYPISFSCAYYITLSPSCNLKPASPVVCQQTIATALLYLKTRYLIPKQCNMQEYDRAFGQFRSFLNNAPTSGCVFAIGDENTLPWLPNDQLKNDFCQQVQNQPKCCSGSPRLKPQASTETASEFGQRLLGPTIPPNTVHTTNGDLLSNTLGTASVSNIPGDIDLVTNVQPGVGTHVPAIAPVVITAPLEDPDTFNPQPTSANRTPDSSDSHSIIVGFGMVGICFLIVLAVVTGLLLHKQSRKPEIDSEKEILQVLYEYVPTMDDELYLGKLFVIIEPGDYIEVEMKYDDGWAKGMNLTSIRGGIFPLAHVGQYC
ncbi:hypothetical protein HDV01_005424 [Terramyces sp. JEL0728]|nr:hypothetical protein HDV01_005424 [Terramyces sp. JEL0728]